MSDANRNSTDCGCCEGLAASTPASVNNRPGLPAIAYRVGTHARFYASMLAALSSLPALQRLRTREASDFSIALLDAWASVADVLTFYQERIANESYLRTATERLSIVGLARLIGYELNPGVAASTHLAFALETAAGAPEEVTIDPSVKVQSLPGPGEHPQIFEPVETITARPEWNELRPRQSAPRAPQKGDSSLYVAGVATNLRKGDAILLVGSAGASDIAFRRVSAVHADADANRTLIEWEGELGADSHDGPLKDVKLYALRLRAPLFGHNAVPWNALPVSLRVGDRNPDPESTPRVLPGAYAGSETKWADAKFSTGTSAINLDAVYSQIVPNTWIVLSAGASGEVVAFWVTSVGEESRADFNLAAKTTRLGISGDGIEKFFPRSTTVFAQAEELTIADAPIQQPVERGEIVLDNAVQGLASGRTVIVYGKKAGVETVVEVRVPTPADRGKAAPDKEVAVQVRAREDIRKKTRAAGAHKQTKEHVAVHGVRQPGRSSDRTIVLPPGAYIAEVATIDQVFDDDPEHTKLVLKKELQNKFDRASTVIYANVTLATHGETTGEVLGSGDPTHSFQQFTLRQSPLTYTPADIPTGGESTLEVRVNGIGWDEAASLFNAARRDRVYVTRIGADGKTSVQFGDGENGSRLPAGVENVTATYRKGIGTNGQVKAGQLNILLHRPLGVKTVRNPQPAGGAQDPQSLDDARANAPLTVLTLDRVVSLRDYEDFARSYAGIAKALACWVWFPRGRGVLLTVSGTGGQQVPDDSRLHEGLVSALQDFGDPRVPVSVKTYRPVSFHVEGSVVVNGDYRSEDVLANVAASLQQQFSFAARSFGQPVALSEVVAIMQNVPGVIAVEVTLFHRADKAPARQTILLADAPQPGDPANVAAAELLTLAAAPFSLGVTP